MAVTGLPEPQPDHAYRMAKFAMHCQSKTALILHELKEKLGEDTVTLDCRIGMHSGPVTAGVLRGDRGRFQLFGDTVNTASRMESTGEKGRIQCSKETADLIIAAGKSSWIVPREDKVLAKGKGEMSTFWILPKGTRGTSVGTSSHGGSAQPGLHRRMYPEDLSETFDESERGKITSYMPKLARNTTRRLSSEDMSEYDESDRDTANYNPPEVGGLLPHTVAEDLSE